MMDVTMAHRGGGDWDGNRYGGDSGYHHQDDGHSAFLELRAVGNPHHHHAAQHRSLDRRAAGGQHFPLSAR